MSAPELPEGLVEAVARAAWAASELEPEYAEERDRELYEQEAAAGLRAALGFRDASGERVVLLASELEQVGVRDKIGGLWLSVPSGSTVEPVYVLPSRSLGDTE